MEEGSLMSAAAPPPEAGPRRGAGASALGWLLLIALLGWGAGHLWPPRSATPTVTPATMLSQPEKIPDEVVISTSDQRPETTPTLLPVTSVPLYCFYRIDRLPAGTPLQVTWSLNGKDLGEVPLQDHRVDRGPLLSGRFSLRPPQGAPQFPPGLYQLFFRSGAETILDASFVAAVDAERLLAQQAPPAGEIRVVSLTTCTGVDAEGRPVGLTGTFRPGDRIYALFTYLNGVKQARFEVRWLSHDVVIPQATQQLEMKAGAGQSYAWLQAAGEGLPEGPGQVQVLVAGSEQPLATVPFTISRSAPPPAAPAPGPSLPAVPAPPSLPPRPTR